MPGQLDIDHTAARPDEVERRDHPNKPFRTPNKTKTHPAPETATDGDPNHRKREAN